MPGLRFSTHQSLSPLPPTQFAHDDKKKTNSLVADPHHPATSTKAIVEAAKVDGPDAELAQGRRAHDARLDRDVEIRILEDRRGVLGEDLAHCHEFGVARALFGRDRELVSRWSVLFGVWRCLPGGNEQAIVLGHARSC